MPKAKIYLTYFDSAPLIPCFGAILFRAPAANIHATQLSRLTESWLYRARGTALIHIRVHQCARTLLGASPLPLYLLRRATLVVSKANLCCTRRVNHQAP